MALRCVASRRRHARPDRRGDRRRRACRVVAHRCRARPTRQRPPRIHRPPRCLNHPHAPERAIPNEAANTHERPVVAIGTTTPRLLTLTDTGRYAVIEALRQYDNRPAGCPDFAHRVTLRDALAACRVPASPTDAVFRAREFLGLPNVGLQ